MKRNLLIYFLNIASLLEFIILLYPSTPIMKFLLDHLLLILTLMISVLFIG